MTGVTQHSGGVYNRTFIFMSHKTPIAMVDLIVKAAVKEYLADNNVSSDFYDALDEEVESLLEDASRRADANGRTTVKPRDL